MTTYVVFLRAVNVGGRNKVAMAKLRDALQVSGFPDAATYIQSGNLVLDSDGSAAEVIDDVHRCIQDVFGLDVGVMARTPEELAAVLAANPFPTDDVDHRTLHIGFLDAEPDDGAVTELKIMAAEAFDDDELAVVGTEIYLHYPNGSGRSRLSNAAIERALGVRCTARNWRTVQTMHDMSRPNVT